MFANLSIKIFIPSGYERVCLDIVEFVVIMCCLVRVSLGGLLVIACLC